MSPGLIYILTIGRSIKFYTHAKACAPLYMCGRRGRRRVYGLLASYSSSVWREMQSRPIGQHENFFHVAQEAFGCLDVMVSRLTISTAQLQDVSAEELLSVHRQVTQRHPMLRCQIKGDGEQRWDEEGSLEEAQGLHWENVVG